MIVTAKMLREHWACEEPVRRFEEKWPRGVEVSFETCLEATSDPELQGRLWWFVDRFLFPEARRFYISRIFAIDSLYQYERAEVLWGAIQLHDTINTATPGHIYGRD